MPKIGAGTTCTATVVSRTDRQGRYLVIVRPQGGAPFKRSFTSKLSAQQYADEFTRLGLRGEDLAAKVDTITPRMLGAVLEAATRSGRSMAVREQIRCPLRRYYTWLRKHEGFTAPNPTLELKDYMGHQESRRERITKPYVAFTRDEARALLAACQARRPRHVPRILVMLKAGLRYGEAAALESRDVLWDKAAIYVQRAWN